MQFTEAQFSLITSVRGFIQCSYRQAVHIANSGLLQCNDFDHVLKTVFSEKYVTEFQESKTYKYGGPYICENDVAARQDLFGNLTKERGNEIRGFKDLCYYSFSKKIDPLVQGNSRCQFYKFYTCPRVDLF